VRGADERRSARGSSSSSALVVLLDEALEVVVQRLQRGKAVRPGEGRHRRHRARGMLEHRFAEGVAPEGVRPRQKAKHGAECLANRDTCRPGEQRLAADLHVVKSAQQGVGQVCQEADLCARFLGVARASAELGADSPGRHRRHLAFPGCGLREQAKAPGDVLVVVAACLRDHVGPHTASVVRGFSEVLAEEVDDLLRESAGHRARWSAQRVVPGGRGAQS